MFSWLSEGGILVIYCCVTSYSKSKYLEEYIFLLCSMILWGRSQVGIVGMASLCFVISGILAGLV